MKTTVYIKCPACGHENERQVEITSTIMPWAVWYCDCEAGGCDKPFAVRLMAEPQARTAVMGEEVLLGAVGLQKQKLL